MDLDEVIAGMSEAQRDEVMRGAASGNYPISVTRALVRKGLQELVIDSPNGRCGFMRNTEAGEAVRARLLAKETDQ